MARGFDSKAVAEQIEEAAVKKVAASPQDQSKTERAVRERAESIRLSRARVLDQISRATNPAYRAMLEKALADLEGELESIEGAALRANAHGQ